MMSNLRTLMLSVVLVGLMLLTVYTLMHFAGIVP